MSELRVRKRRRLREKETKALVEQLESRIGGSVFPPNTNVDVAESPEFEVVLVENQVVAFIQEGKPFLTVRGLLRYPAQKAFVTVDMGAVKFVINGADIMGPGIVEADPGIQPGDFVWIRDEKNRRPLAVGTALVSGAEMQGKKPGKAIKSLLYVGDKLWKFDER